MKEIFFLLWSENNERFSRSESERTASAFWFLFRWKNVLKKKKLGVKVTDDIIVITTRKPFVEQPLLLISFFNNATYTE